MNDMFSIMFVVILVLLFIIAFIMSSYIDYKNVPKLISVLKKEDMVLFPIGILMLGYQIYTSGKWGLSPETTNYILMFIYFLNIIVILIYRYLWNKIENEDKFIFLLCLNILFTPFYTVAFLVMMLFHI